MIKGEIGNYMSNDVSNVDLTKELIEIIKSSKEKAFQKINEVLISMYWKVGEKLYNVSKDADFGDNYIDKIASNISDEFPGIKGFDRRGLYRMKQFYETYKDDQFVTTLLTQISWSNHMLIISKAKTIVERHFYISLCIKEHYSYRELERQISSAYYERYMLSKDKILPEKIVGSRVNPFLDSYVLEFLDLPRNYSEKDFQKGLLENMKNFILELGKDFTFVGNEYKVKVGNEDYYIDLLFYHRELKCLVAFELKIDKFKPEYISKMDFYLEALDREYKKKDENPSVGIILCATKDEEVVEYAMSRTMSPLLVSEYKLKLPDKKILTEKLRDFVNIGNKE